MQRCYIASRSRGGAAIRPGRFPRQLKTHTLDICMSACDHLLACLGNLRQFRILVVYQIRQQRQTLQKALFCEAVHHVLRRSWGDSADEELLRGFATTAS